MIILKRINDLTLLLEKQRKKNYIIGFVPTMGALHKGHISLVEKALADCNIVVCSIFVNPTQFNDPEDFKKYPNTISNDINLLEKTGIHVLFYPSITEMYRENERPKHYQLGYLETILDGKYRSGHFQGVCRVVDKLLKIVTPDKVYFGQKDYQQCMVIKKMMDDENIKSEMIICDTVREESGLAMSSRNMRLSNDALDKATHLYKALQHIKNNLHQTSLVQLKQEATVILLSNGFSKVDYIEICNPQTLQSIQQNVLPAKVVVMAATFIDEVRLIDNLLN